MEWFKNEEFWRELYPYMFPAERLEAAAEQVSQVLALTGFTGRTVLDLCCGPGRHSVQFAQRGFDVTGVDRSAFLLERARDREAESGVRVEWVDEDMLHFTRPAAFDLVCNLFTSFGYFENEDDDLRVLRNIHESLVPGGAFVIDVLGKERLSRVWTGSICTQFPDGTLLVQRPQVRHDWTRIYNEWTLVKEDRARTFSFEHTVYSGRELKDRLLMSGFAQVQLFGGLDGAPYGMDAARLVAVARKAC